VPDFKFDREQRGFVEHRLSNAAESVANLHELTARPLDASAER
jgi:hypothetical protein